jgi:hypothetical protein
MAHELQLKEYASEPSVMSKGVSFDDPIEPDTGEPESAPPTPNLSSPKPKPKPKPKPIFKAPLTDKEKLAQKKIGTLASAAWFVNYRAGGSSSKDKDKEHQAKRPRR